MNEFALYVFDACAIAAGGILYHLGIWLEEKKLRREYEKERRDFHDAIDRGETHEKAPVYIGPLGNASVEFRDIVRTERFKRQLAGVERIRKYNEKA